MDQPSSLDATSLPFVFEHMQLQGRIISMDLDVLDTAISKPAGVKVDTSGAKSADSTMPLSLDVVSFP